MNLYQCIQRELNQCEIKRIPPGDCKKIWKEKCGDLATKQLKRMTAFRQNIKKREDNF